jgi:hypothetical protein
MKTIIISTIAVAVVAIIAIPALKGPINRLRNEANDKLNAEYVVDNYKAEYVAMYDKRVQLLEAVSKFTIEKKVAEKKREQAMKEVAVLAKQLKDAGTADMKKFASLKSVYDVRKSEADNYATMITTYEQALVKLEKSKQLLDVNMAKAKHNVDVLSSKKTMLDTIKTVNKSIANVTGIGDTDLAINLEKLDDDTIRESVKLETFDADVSPTMNEAEAKAFIDTL